MRIFRYLNVTKKTDSDVKANLYLSKGFVEVDEKGKETVLPNSELELELELEKTKTELEEVKKELEELKSKKSPKKDEKKGDKK